MYEETDERRAGTPRLDDRFADAEREVDRGEPWRFREPGAPNPITLEVVELTNGFTKLGPATWLNGVDRDGRRWSILVGGVVLRKHLLEGLVEEWDVDAHEFRVVDVLGPVRPGEVVSIKYTGDVAGAKYDYPTFRVSRKPAPAAEPPDEPDAAGDDAVDVDDEPIPF